MTHNLDQHFLIDKRFVITAVANAHIKDTDIVLEIGPGKGILTKALLNEATHVIAIEKDESLIPHLKELSEHFSLELHHADAIEILPTLTFTKLVANIPYTITEPLMHALLKKEFELAILLLGNTFYEHIVSKDSKWSVLIPLFFEYKKLKDVPRDSFDPRPKVNSCLLKLVKREASNEKEKFLQTLFIQEDKLTKNALMNAYTDTQSLTKRQAKEAIQSLELSEVILEKRLMKLSNKEFFELIHAL